MKLSAEVRHEINVIRTRINDLATENSLPASGNFNQIKYLHKQELQNYKIRFETLYSDLDGDEHSHFCRTCETDKINLLQLSISIEGLLTDAMSDDYGRYVQMGLKMKPKSPVFLLRY